MWARRRVWLRTRRRGPGFVPGKGGQFLISAVLGVGLALLLIRFFDAQIRPLAAEMAKARAANAVTRIVSDAVERTLSAEAVAYGDMITLEKDGAGQITALTSNSVEMNKLRSQIMDDIVAQVDSLDSAELSVPLGNLTGLVSLSEKGPGLPVRVISAASADADFRNVFSEAGINQTYHQIVLDVSVNLKLLIPGQVVEIAVTTQVSVAETVIVGKVPDAYLQFGDKSR